MPLACTLITYLVAIYVAIAFAFGFQIKKFEDTHMKAVLNMFMTFLSSLVMTIGFAIAGAFLYCVIFVVFLCSTVRVAIHNLIIKLTQNYSHQNSCCVVVFKGALCAFVLQLKLS